MRMRPGELLALLGYGSSAARYRQAAGEAAALLSEADERAKTSERSQALGAKATATTEAKAVREGYERAAKAAAKAAAIAKEKEREAVAVEGLLRRGYELHEHRQRVAKQQAEREARGDPQTLPPTPPKDEAV